MVIIADSREQQSFTFTRYSVDDGRDWSSHISLERKSGEDLLQTISHGRDRFIRELERAASLSFFAVVIECTAEDISRGRFRSRMNPHSALQTCITFQLRYRFPFVWAGNRAGGEYVTHGLLSKYLRELEQRFEQATKAQVK